MTTASQLIEWVAEGAIKTTAAQYANSVKDIPSAKTVKWPDGSSGHGFALVRDDAHHQLSSFAVTHANSGLAVIQDAVTRRSDGVITARQALRTAAMKTWGDVKTEHSTWGHVLSTRASWAALLVAP